MPMHRHIDGSCRTTPHCTGSLTTHSDPLSIFTASLHLTIYPSVFILTAQVPLKAPKVEETRGGEKELLPRGEDDSVLHAR